MNLLIINTFLEFTTVIIIFSCIMQTKLHKHPKNIITAFIIFFSQVIIQFYLYRTYTINLPDTIALLLVLVIIFNETLLYKICWLTVYTLFEAVTAYMLSNIIFIFLNLFNISGNALNLLAYSDITTFALFIACSLAFRKKCQYIKHYTDLIEKRNYYLIIFSCFITLILLNLSQIFFYEDIAQILKYIIILMIFLLIITLLITITSFLISQYNNAILKEKDKINQKCLEMEQVFNKQIEQKNNDLRAFRHDFNSHMLTLQVLVQDEKWEQVKNYLSKLSIIHTQNFYISTGNIIADAVTNQFYNTLDNNILFKTSGYFKQDCFIDGIDICTILSNLLNNALEALSHLEDNIKKEIYLDIDDTKNRISILMQNSSVNYDGIDTCNIQTTKTDTINHGYGLLNIKNTIEKYHGLMKIHCHNNIFTTFIILNKPLPL